MPITERTLRRWRKEALGDRELFGDVEGIKPTIVESYEELVNRILRMTQELLDQHLLRKK